MIIPSDGKHMLYIEPEKAPTEALIDKITKKLTAAFRKAEKVPSGTKGFHIHHNDRGCMAGSDSNDYMITCKDGTKIKTNLLCIHYVAFHRSEVEDLDLVLILHRLLDEEAEPTEKELQPPRGVKNKPES